MSEELSHNEKVLLYVIGVCDGLREKGMLQGGPTMAMKGRDLYAELCASGFRPTDAEMESALRHLTKGTPQ